MNPSLDRTLAWQFRNIQEPSHSPFSASHAKPVPSTLVSLTGERCNSGNRQWDSVKAPAQMFY